VIEGVVKETKINLGAVDIRSSGKKASLTLTTPTTLIARTCLIASHAEKLVHQPIPALLARISRRLKLSVISLAAAPTEASSVKSICMTAGPPLIRSFPRLDEASALD
jgi:hypothetical protein